MLDALPREDIITAMDRLVEELLDEAHVEAPPVDAIALAQGHLGIEICLDGRQQQRGRAQRSAGKKQIYLRPEPTEERHQWTVAHEIGEHLKVRLLERLNWPAEETRAMTGESLANLFAHHLLVPGRWFTADVHEFRFDLLQLKQRYRTSSHEVLAWRFLDLPDPCIVTIIDNDRISRRKSNAWPTRRRLEPAEEKCQRQVHQTGEPRRVAEDGWSVQGWPVHQTAWQREILRSVVEEE
jgi:Zn-dependent peptidase ImmA (M78 family)